MKNQTIDTFIGKLLDRFSKNSIQTGLVLSGGAARGFAHAGAMQAMKEKDIKPDIISGVSAGSIMGALYCDGHSPEESYELFDKYKIFELVKFRFMKKGLLSTSGLRKLLKENLKAKRIEDLEIPLVITATNIEKGITTYFTEGNLVDTVVASCSIPVLFKPGEVNGVTYVDGGVTNNFPLEPIEDKCKKLIGVHVNPIGPYDPQKGIRHIAMNAFHMSIAAGLETKAERLDYFIEPEALKKYSYYDIKYGKEMFDIGYKEAKKVLEA